MARIPDIIRRNPVTELNQIGVQAGSAFRDLAQFARAAEEFVRPAAKAEARQQGAESVYRDKDGVLRVSERSPLGGELAAEHNAAAYGNYMAKFRMDLRANTRAISQQFEMDPSGFLNAMQTYISQLGETAPAALAPEVMNVARAEGQRIAIGMQDEVIRRDRLEADKSSRELVDQLTEDYVSLASEGAPPEEQMAALSELDAALDYRTAMPFIKFTEDDHKAILSGAVEAGAAGRGGRLASDDPQAVLEALAAEEGPEWAESLTSDQRIEIQAKAEKVKTTRQAEADAEFMQRRRAAETEGYLMWARGEVSSKWLEENAAYITDDAYGLFSTAARNSGGSTDAAALAEIETIVDQTPETAIAAAAEAFADGRLSRSAFEDVYGQATGEADHPLVASAKAELRSAFPASSFDYETSLAFSRARRGLNEITGETDADLRKNIRDYLDTAVETGREDVRRARQSRLETPSFASGPISTRENLDAAVAATLRAKRAGKITEAEFREQARILYAWKGTFDDG